MFQDKTAELLRAIPSVQWFLSHPTLQQSGISPIYLKKLVQQVIHNFREQVQQNGTSQPSTAAAVPRFLLKKVQERMDQIQHPYLQRVVNATGVILHTNMGRALLSPAAVQAIQQAATHYTNLELDLKRGRRGNRLGGVEPLLTLLTGAEAALVVNNNAAAVLLVLHTLCRRKQVIVSRGELVEIGGSFRMPEVIKASGARMLEVGTTNKTHLHDYENAISEKTAAILKVHSSNYKIVGFAQQVPVDQLVPLAHRHQLPLIYDMGSGALMDLGQWHLPAEPLVQSALARGVDIVTFSGDKLLGGPQAGIIVGKARYLEKMRRNHLLRALRCDKLTLAALEATLRLYLQPQQLPQKLPVYKMLTRTLEELRALGESILARVRNPRLRLSLVPAQAQAGSGSLPAEEIPSLAIAVESIAQSEQYVATQLRQYRPPILGVVQQKKVLLNLRTIQETDVPVIADALNQI